jgi:hypothetical protein
MTGAQTSSRQLHSSTHAHMQSRLLENSISLNKINLIRIFGFHYVLKFCVYVCKCLYFIHTHLKLYTEDSHNQQSCSQAAETGKWGLTTTWRICHRSTYHACVAQCQVPLSFLQQTTASADDTVLSTRHVTVPTWCTSTHSLPRSLFDGLRYQTQKADIPIWMVISHKPHVYEK